MRPTTHLLKQAIFTDPYRIVPGRAGARLCFERARAIVQAYDFNFDDISTLSQKFWDMHTDPIMTLDGAATTLATIQVNLAAGTLSQYVNERDDLLPLIDDLLKFRKIGQFCLTEVGHGLDIAGLETEARLLPSGEFDLHSPSQRAAKYMPPTVPMGDIPCVGIIWAKLIVGSEVIGIRPFLVTLNDGHYMTPGVTAIVLPHRGGVRPVNHSLTSFEHVRLPPNALLGSPEKSSFEQFEFMSAIWRVAVGSIALGSILVPVLKVYSSLAAIYSTRRTITGKDNAPTPILSFRTQEIPVYTAIAQAFVLEAFQKWAVKIFTDPELDPRTRHGVATCLKAILVQHSQSSNLALSERCGAQGLMDYNQFAIVFTEVRGISIAEGDILVMSIRLATELLQGRYALPPAANEQSLLARHESAVRVENQAFLRGLPHHRAPEVNAYILPQCQAMVEAAGHRMAYDAAVAAGVAPYLIDMYVASVVKLDPAWYSEHAGLNRRAQAAMEDDAVTQIAPHVPALIEKLAVTDYISAPIVSDERWDTFVAGLERHEAPRVSGRGRERFHHSGGQIQATARL